MDIKYDQQPNLIVNYSLFEYTTWYVVSLSCKFHALINSLQT